MYEHYYSYKRFLVVYYTIFSKLDHLRISTYRIGLGC